MPNMNNNYLSHEDRQAVIRWLAVNIKNVVEAEGLTQAQAASKMSDELGFKVTTGNIASAIKMLNLVWPSKSNLIALEKARAIRMERLGKSPLPPKASVPERAEANGTNDDPYEIVKSACISLDAIAQILEESRDGKMLVASMALRTIITRLEGAKKKLT